MVVFRAVSCEGVAGPDPIIPPPRTHLHTHLQCKFEKVARFPGLPEKPLLRVTRFYDESRKLARTELTSEQCRQLYLAFEVRTVGGVMLCCARADDPIEHATAQPETREAPGCWCMRRASFRVHHGSHHPASHVCAYGHVVCCS